MRNLILTMTLISLAAFGAGCFKKEENPYKVILRDEIYGRALGLGGAEELFQPQVWVNFSMIHLKGMLQEASKMVYQTTDPAFANRNKTEGIENGEILVLDDGKSFGQIDTRPMNAVAFENSISQWSQHAQQMGGAQDPILGEVPKSGTPFRSQQLSTNNSQALHEYRKGKISTFLEEIHREWIIPGIAKEINKGQKWSSDFTVKELQSIVGNVVNNVARDAMTEVILSGRNPEPGEEDALKQSFTLDFMKKGKTRFLEIFKGELNKAVLNVKVNIAGKQSDLADKVDKLSNVFGQVMASPQVLQSPFMAELFNNILEYSGLDVIDFTGFAAPAPPTPAPTPAPLVNQPA